MCRTFGLTHFKADVVSDMLAHSVHLVQRSLLLDSLQKHSTPCALLEYHMCSAVIDQMVQSGHQHVVLTARYRLLSSRC